MSRRIFIATALAVLVGFGLKSEGQLLPAMDAGYGSQPMPVGGVNGTYEGLVGIPWDINDVVQDAQFTTVYNPTISIPNSALVCPTDGVSDCYAALQTALTNCPGAAPFCKIQLPVGYYYCSKPLVCYSNFVDFAGTKVNGAPGTFIGESNYAASAPNPILFSIKSKSSDQLDGAMYVSNWPAFGSNWFTIPLGNSSTYGTWAYQLAQTGNILTLNFATNMEIVLTSATDENYISTNNFDGESALGGNRPPTNGIAQLCRIGTNIGTNGPLVYITNQFGLDFDFTNQPRAYFVHDPIIGSGVEDIGFYNFYTNLEGTKGGLVDLRATEFCFLKDVTIMNTISDGVFCDLGWQSQFQDLYLRYACFTLSGQGYGLHFFGPNFGDLFEDAVIWSYRHSEIGEGQNIACVWAYCWNIGDNNYTESSNWVTDDCITHAMGNLYCLFEGIFCHHPDVDAVHGTSGIHILFWRCFWNWGATNTPGNPLCLAETNLYVPLGLAQASPNGQPYLQNRSGMSIETSNKYVAVVGCVSDIATVSNFNTGANSGPFYYGVQTLSGTNYAYRFGWATLTSGSGPGGAGGTGGSGGEGGGFFGDLTPSNTFYIDDTFSHITGTNQWANGAHSVPASAYLAGQPGWWNAHGGSPKWPPVTPENGVNNMLPSDWQYMLPSTVKWLTTESNLVKFATTWPYFLMNH